MECTHVFMHLDCHRFPLDCACSGPYRAHLCNNIFFTLDLNTQVDTVSINRLKPAFLDELQGQAQGPVPPPVPEAFTPAVPFPTSITTLLSPLGAVASYKGYHTQTSRHPCTGRRKGGAGTILYLELSFTKHSLLLV